MEVNPTTFPTAGANTPPPSQTDKAVAKLSSDFETFLVMLTTQLENQDPLNPIESADFAVQLATFSSVEQQVLTNELLTGLGAQFGSLGVSQLSGWIGLDARTQAPVEFSGAPIAMNVQVAEQADSAELVVRDTKGAVLQRSSVPPISGEIEWAGVDETGAPLPPGAYALSVESFANKEPIESRAIEIQSRITEARSENGQTILVLKSGQQVLASDILGLSEPKG